jgi:hypothetical protein
VPDEDRRAGRSRTIGQLAQQPRLADPGVPLDDDGPRLPGARAAERVEEDRHSLGAPDERGLPAGHVGHAGTWPPSRS